MPSAPCPLRHALCAMPYAPCPADGTGAVQKNKNQSTINSLPAIALAVACAQARLAGHQLKHQVPCIIHPLTTDH